MAAAAGFILSTAREIAVLENTTTRIIYDLPHGRTFTGSGFGLSSKPGSILECRYASLDRITIADSEKLLSKCSAEKKAEAVFARTVLFDLNTELFELAKSMPREDRLDLEQKEYLELYKGLTKDQVGLLFLEVDRLRKLSDAELREEHTKGGACESFEHYKADIVRKHVQYSRFIKDSKHATLFDDLFERSDMKFSNLVAKHVIKFGKEYVLGKIHEYQKQKYAKKLTDGSLCERVRVKTLYLDKILYEKLGMIPHSFFFKTPKDVQAKIASMYKTAKEIGEAAEKVDAIVDSMGFAKEEVNPGFLIRFLKKNGPFIANGFYGRSCYKDEPSLLTGTPKLGEREVLAWPKGAVRYENSTFFAHCVTIIGAIETPEKKGRVYYLDPMDPIEGSSGLLDKIYCISFENFIQNHIDCTYTPDLGLTARM